MGNKRKSLVIVVMAVLLCLSMVLAACDDGNQQTPGTPAYDGPYEIRITAIGSTTIRAGSTVQLRSSVTGTTNKDVTYSSSDESIATVSDRGVVTGLKAGEVTITVSLVIEPLCRATIDITVEQAVTPTSITIDSVDAVQWAGQTLQLNATVTPDEAYACLLYTSDAADE